MIIENSEKLQLDDLQSTPVDYQECFELIDHEKVFSPHMIQVPRYYRVLFYTNLKFNSTLILVQF